MDPSKGCSEFSISKITGLCQYWKSGCSSYSADTNIKTFSIKSPVSCSTSLTVNSSYSNQDIVITYNSAGQDTVVIDSYLKLFDHTLQTDCPINKGEIKAQGCVDDF